MEGGSTRFCRRLRTRGWCVVSFSLLFTAQKLINRIHAAPPHLHEDPRPVRLLPSHCSWRSRRFLQHVLPFLPHLYVRFRISTSSFSSLITSSFLTAPRAAHRFVGYLEEEACKTYTHIIEAIERGEIPEWDPKNPSSVKVPQVAKDYWRLGDSATS
jgi:hypothetical protein